MLIRVGMEEDPGKQYTAWALNFPGCFAYGTDQAEALLALPRKLLEFDYWIRLHTDQPWFQLDGIDVHVDETFTVTRIDFEGEEYEINAFYKDDLRPLTNHEVDQTSQILRWQQEELLAGIEFLDTEKLNRVEQGQRWSILGIVRHLAFTELCYMQNLGLTIPDIPRDKDPIFIFEQSYKALISALPGLVSNPRFRDYGKERWSARKLIRRTLGHRRDHIDHIRQLLGII